MHDIYRGLVPYREYSLGVWHNSDVHVHVIMHVWVANTIGVIPTLMISLNYLV